jgi:hypothetical protein
MKLRHALSLTAFFAGAGLGLAQDAAGRPAATAAPAAPAVLQPAPAVGPRGPVMMDGVAPTPANLVPGAGCATGCGNGHGAWDTTVVPDFRVYGRLEYILWRTGRSFKDAGTDRLPALRSPVPIVFPARSINTALDGTITTRQGPFTFESLVNLNPVLFSGSSLDALDRNGGRLTIGGYLDTEHDTGVELSYFQLEQRQASFAGLASGTAVIQPDGLVDATEQTPPATPELTPTSFSAFLRAGVTGTSSSNLYSLEANVRKLGVRIGTARLEGLMGLRYFNYDEKQNLTEAVSIQNATYITDALGTPLLSTTTLTSSINSRNRFLGPQIGGAIEAYFGPVFVNGTAKLAVGGMHQETGFQEAVANDLGLGVSQETFPNPTSFSGSRTRFTILPEVAANIGYDVTDNIRIMAGYDILYIRRLIRPTGNGRPVSSGGTITVLNAAAAPIGPALTNFNEDKMIVHGFTFGLEVRY